MTKAIKKYKKYSSDSFDNSKFKGHGLYELHIEDGILYADVAGPFNLEGMVALTKARAAAIAESGSRNLDGAVVTFRGSLLMSQEAIDAYARGVEDQIKAGTHVGPIAWVADQAVEGKRMMVEKLKDIFATRAIAWKVFDDLASGSQWMQETLGEKPKVDICSHGQSQETGK